MQSRISTKLILLEAKIHFYGLFMPFCLFVCECMYTFFFSAELHSKKLVVLVAMYKIYL